MNTLTIPKKRELEGWDLFHKKHTIIAETSHAEVMLIGDSIVKHFIRHQHIWRCHFAPLTNINFGISGDCIQHVLWRIKFGSLPPVKTIIIHVGTNNAPKDNPLQIAEGLICLVKNIRGKSNAHIILTGLFPRSDQRYTNKIIQVNKHV